MASGCGLALSCCCSQRYVPEAVAETYLWSARVHYPSDNGSGVAAGGVFARQWCLAAWCVSTQCIPEPTAAQQNHSVIKRCLAFMPARVCDFQTYRCILIYYLLDSVPLQTTCNMTARRMKRVLFFSEYVLFQWKALQAAPIGNRKHHQTLPWVTSGTFWVAPVWIILTWLSC